MSFIAYLVRSKNVLYKNGKKLYIKTCKSCILVHGKIYMRFQYSTDSNRQQPAIIHIRDIVGSVNQSIYVVHFLNHAQFLIKSTPKLGCRPVTKKAVVPDVGITATILK